MPKNYSSEVFPLLAKRGHDLTAFYEIKANLTIDELRALRDGGIVHLQPGIESLSKRLLKAVKKGVTGLQNVYFLKWSRYFGIEISWNLLWGIPGETPDDYDKQIAVFERISHLDPPSSMPEIRIQRFSPMQERPVEFGIEGMRTARTFAALFPEFRETHNQLTYFFDIDGRVGISLEKAAEVFSVVELWREDFRKGSSLFYARIPGRKISFEDRRQAGTCRTDVFAFPASATYELCSLNIMSCERLSERLQAELRITITPDDLKPMLDQFCDRGLMIEEDGLYLAIAIPVSNQLRKECTAEYTSKLLSAYTPVL